jgi:hypothetical protein
MIAGSLHTIQASHHHKILCKTATHQHQKVILRLICMELPTSKNTNAHMTTSKA